MFALLAIVALLSFLIGWRGQDIWPLLQPKALTWACGALVLAIAIAVALQLGGVTTAAVLRFMLTAAFSLMACYIGWSARTIFGGIA